MNVCRRITFNAAHRLFVPEWSDEKNKTVFGKCSNPNYHGHNYVLETWVDGPVDPVTGFVFDLSILNSILKEKIMHRFDHKNLNLDCEEFTFLNPTAENIAIVIWNSLRKELNPTYRLTVKLWETENNVVEYSGN